MTGELRPLPARRCERCRYWKGAPDAGVARCEATGATVEWDAGCSQFLTLRRSAARPLGAARPLPQRELFE